MSETLYRLFKANRLKGCFNATGWLGANSFFYRKICLNSARETA